MKVQYKRMEHGDEGKVCALVEKVFNEFVAPDYGPEGVDEFYRFADPDALAERAKSDQFVVICQQGLEFVGMIEMVKGNHIAMLFVVQRGEGVGRELVRIAVAECQKKQPGLKQITVNSSRFAEPFYCRMGFKATGSFQEKKGIFFLPMVCDLE